MSKPVKEMIRKQIVGRLEGVTSVAVVDLTGIDAITNNEIRGRLLEKDMHISVVKNSLAKQAFKEVGLETAAELLTGPCALAWGSDSIVSVVRELRDIAKEVKMLNVKGALLDGDLFGADRMAELADFPTREEAIGQVVGAILSAGSNVSSCIIAPGSQIASVLKKIEEDGGDSEDAGSPVPADSGDSDDSGGAVAVAAEAPATEAPAEEASAEEASAEEAPAEEDKPAGDEAAE